QHQFIEQGPVFASQPVKTFSRQEIAGKGLFGRHAPQDFKGGRARHANFCKWRFVCPVLRSFHPSTVPSCSFAPFRKSRADIARLPAGCTCVTRKPVLLPQVTVKLSLATS